MIYRLAYYDGAVKARLLVAQREGRKARSAERSMAEAAARTRPRAGSAWSFATAQDPNTK